MGFYCCFAVVYTESGWLYKIIRSRSLLNCYFLKVSFLWFVKCFAYRQRGLTLTIYAKVFSNPVSPNIDPHQYTYLREMSTEDAMSIELYLVISQLNKNGTYSRILFMDFSSAFITVILSNNHQTHNSGHRSYHLQLAAEPSDQQTTMFS